MHKLASDVSEAIASKDRNNLYITSTFFTDRIKYRVFCAYYALMRIIDDRIDNLPPSSRGSSKSLKFELSVVMAWEKIVRSCCNGIYPTASLLTSCDFAETEVVCESFINSYRVFPVPVWLWEKFFGAMRSDLLDGEFDRWSDFLAYAEGAAISPTTIYLLLIMARRNVTKDSYDFPREFDLYACGRHLGIFAYLAHIIRDLALDIKRASTRLCIAREDMMTYGVTLEMLRSEALKNQASSATRRLVEDYLKRARWHLAQARAMALPTLGFIERDSRFILELIITLYEHIIEKIESTGCDPMLKQSQLAPPEKSAIIQEVATKMGFSLPSFATV